jgi:DnaJ-class molecular chaperone
MAEPCTECDFPSDGLTSGNGKCNLCSGTGIDISVAVLAGLEGDCERCGGTGVCPVCNGRGEVEIKIADESG